MVKDQVDWPMSLDEILSDCVKERPILIAGPTASGKSALGLKLAQALDGEIINADALQIYAHWEILTARPSAADCATVSHHLYGHRPLLEPYSVGDWLRELDLVLEDLKDRRKTPIILGGTGLYFQALTQGLADIPPISDEIRAQADALEAEQGRDVFRDILSQDDPDALLRLDPQNPARTRRAWEVWQQTGRPMREWQDETGPALIAQSAATPILLECPVDWLNARIEMRADIMFDTGAIAETLAILDAGLWDPSHPSCKAIGAFEIVAHLQGKMGYDDMWDAVVTQTRQYAKRQRTWFRSKMSDWKKLAPNAL